MILHQLPARELLLSTQVNKQFYNVIRSSPELQHKLYFKVEVVAKGGRIFPLEFNPLMKFCWPKDNSGVLKTNLESFHRYDLPTASWKDMFVTTPAVTYLYVISGGVPCTRLESESGITMGQLVKSQQERYKEEINPNRSEDLFIYYGTYSVSHCKPNVFHCFH